MQMPPIGAFVTDIERAFASGALRGDFSVEAIPRIGPYLGDRLVQRLGGGVDRVDRVLQHLAGLGSRAAVVGALTATLRNERARARILVRKSPILDGNEGGRVVNDVNAPGYSTMCALMRVVSRMSSNSRAHRMLRRSRGLAAVRVPPHLVPPPYTRLGLAAMHCGAHHDDRGTCLLAARHCRWVGPTHDNDNDNDTNCVPRATTARSGPGLGSNVPPPNRRLSAQRRAQLPIAQDEPGPPLEAWDGNPTTYIGGWFK